MRTRPSNEPGATGAVMDNSPARVQMAMFDDLDPKVRAALREAPFDFSPKGLAFYRPEVAIALIETQTRLMRKA